MINTVENKVPIYQRRHIMLWDQSPVEGTAAEKEEWDEENGGESWKGEQEREGMKEEATEEALNWGHPFALWNVIGK